jgi:outer membrane protein assembly factor BamB
MFNNKKMTIYRAFVFIVTFILGSLFLFFSYVLPEGVLSNQWKIDIDEYINAYTISSWGQRIAIGTDQGQVFVYDHKGQLIYEKNFKDPIQGLYFSDKGEYLYVKTYNLLMLDIANNSVLWEKFKPNHYVDKFWVFHGGNLGFLFSSKTSLGHIFLLTDKKGVTLHEFNLPELYEDFESDCSPNGKFLFISTEGSDLYHMNLDGMVNWMMRLDPPASKLNYEYPIAFDINPEGEVVLAYSFEQYGKKGHQVVYINDSGEIMWRSDTNQALLKLEFSSDGQKILVNTTDDLFVLRKDGTRLFDEDQFGYHSLDSRLYATYLTISYYSKHLLSLVPSSIQELPPEALIRSITLDTSKIKWQKRIKQKDQLYIISTDGRHFLEVVKPGSVKFYGYVSTKLFKKEGASWLQ